MMKRKTPSEDGANGGGPSEIPKEEQWEYRFQYTSRIQSSDHGFEYQKNLAVLLLLRATRRSVPFSLAYEMTDAGHFDDVVFIDEDKNCLLFQIKHGLSTGNKDPVDMNTLFLRKTDESRSKRKDGFCLARYLESYPCNLQNLPERKHFIIFTNRRLIRTDELMEKVVITEEHLEPTDILYFNDSCGKPIRFKPTADVATEMMDYVNQKSKKDLSEANVHDFFNNLTLLFEQPDELDEFIRNELVAWMRAWIHPTHLGKRDMGKDLEHCIEQLKNCIDKDSQYDKKSKTALTLKEGKQCLLKIQQGLEGEIRMLNHTNPTLAKVEDYYISRQVKVSDTNNEPFDDLCNLLTGTYAKDKIIILSAKPGMGKSVLFYHISFQIQKSTDSLVFLIYLHSLKESLEQSSQIDSLEETVEVLKNVLISSNCDIILKASKCGSLNGQRICMFLDGFDEIAPMHEKKVIQMIQTLMMINGIQIIVSGRRHVENLLREKFSGARYLYLIPFSENDKTSFLKKRWGEVIQKNTKNYSKFESYAAHLLRKFNCSIDNSWCDFLGIPLLIEMFAEVKKDGFVQFISSNEAQDVETLASFSVVKLYGEFIEKSLKLKNDKMNQSGRDGYDSNKNIILKHQLLAVHILECEEICQLLGNPGMKTEFDQFVQNIELGHENSPLVECVNGEVQFTHRSYAEYLVAKYLYDNFNECNKSFKPHRIFSLYERNDIVRKLLLNMIEEQGKPNVHFETISKMCKIQNDFMVYTIFKERCFNILKYLIVNNSSFVNNFYLYDRFNHFCQPVHLAIMFGYEEIVHLLIEKGANINAQCSKKLVPLCYALKDKRMVQLLLNYSASVSAQDYFGMTPLCNAVGYGRTEVAKMLIEHKIDKNIMVAVNHAVRFGKISLLRPSINKVVLQNYLKGSEESPFPNADSNNIADACKDEFSQTYENFEDFEGKSPLHFAAESTQFDLVKLLMEKSTSINIQDNQGKIPLHYAAKAGQLPIFEWLLKKTNDANLQDFEGKTPLHIAAEAGHHQIVELLLQKTEDVNLTDCEGMKPLHYASKAGHYEIVEMLLKISEVMFRDIHDMLPLDYASQENHHQVVELLLKKSIDEAFKNRKRESPLHFAAKSGLLKIVELLLGKGKNINSKDINGRTPLHCAVEVGQYETVKLLLKKLADVNAQDKQSKTPLHYAVQGGDYKTVKLLLEQSADIDAQDEEGNKPLHYAIRKGKLKIIELILTKSAQIVNDSNNQGNTHLCCEVEKILGMLKNAEDVNLRDNHDKPSLLFIAVLRLLQIVKMMLEKQQYINSRYLRDRTSSYDEIRRLLYELNNKEHMWCRQEKKLLRYAAKEGRFGIVKLLLLISAEVGAQDNERNAPLQKYLRDDQTVQIILKNLGHFDACDVNVSDYYGRTPLHFAALNSDYQFVKLLLDESAVADVQDRSGNTPFDHAIRNGDYQIIELFLAQVNEQNVNIQDSQGKTQLHYAAESGLHRILVMLLVYLEDVNLQDFDAEIVLRYAAVLDRLVQIVKLLLRKEKYINAKELRDKKTPHYVAIHLIVELLLEKSANVDVYDPIVPYMRGKTLLHFAAKAGHYEIVELLLNKFADVNAKDKEGKTSLHCAAEAGHIEIVKLLMKKSADADAQDIEGNKPLQYALRNGNYVIVELLLENSAQVDAQDVNVPDFYGKTRLHYAAEAGLYRILKKLLENAAAVNLRDIHGKTSLHYAAIRGHHEIVELLLKKFAHVDEVDVNVPDMQGKTSLHYAVEAGHEKIVELLLKKSADVGAQDKERYTPLSYAAKAGHRQIVKLLLENLAVVDAPNVNMPDKLGKTHLHYAVEAGLPRIVEVLLKECTDVNLQDPEGKTLLYYAANINQQDVDGRTPLHYAVERRDQQMIEALLKKSANVDIQDIKSKETPLLCAAKAGMNQIVALLFDKSEDLSLQDSEGGTLLHYTAKTGLIEIVGRLLLKNVVNVDLQDKLNKTPLHYAAQAGHKQIVSMLLGKSSNENLRDLKGKAALHYAAEGGHFEIVDLMAKSENFLLQDNNGMLPLHYAAKAGLLKIIELLLGKLKKDDFQTMLNERQPASYRVAESMFKKTIEFTFDCFNRWNSLLHDAVEKPAIVECLLDNCVDINLRDKCGAILLYHAVEERQVETVKLLLARSCNINLQDIHGRTPLHYVAKGRCQEIVELLVKKNVDIYSKDSEGITVLLYTAERECQELPELLLEKCVGTSFQDLQDSKGKTVLHYAIESRQVKFVELLLIKSVNINLKSGEGKTPLHYAVNTSWVDIYEFIMKKSAHVDLQGSKGQSPLHYPETMRSLKIVQLLLKKSVGVNLQDADAKTPLHYAAREGKQEIAKLLLDNSADVNLQDAEGNTPLHYAAASGNLQIVELLLEKSGDVNIPDKFKYLPIHYAANAGHRHIVAKLQTFTDNRS